MQISLSLAWVRWAEKHPSILVFSYTTYFTIVRVYIKFEDFGSNSRWKICDWFLWKRTFLFVLRFYGPVNTMGSCRARTILLTTLFLGMLSPLCIPNFKILGVVFPEKTLTQIALCITLDWELEKRKKVKRRQNKVQHRGLFYTTYFYPL